MTKKTKTTKVVRKKQPDSKLSIVPAQFTQKQLLCILQKTPVNHIYRRPAKGGGEWEYVTGVYIKKVLNYIFAWNWDFSVVEHGREEGLIWVLGRLTVRNNKGQEIIKTQFGRADVKYKRGTKEQLDFGNDLKAAATDALKKCASELGIASDVYGKNEFKQIQSEDKSFIPPKTEEEKKEETGERPKLLELKSLLTGVTDEEKSIDLAKRTSIQLNNFDITEKHAGILIATLLNK